VTSGSSYFLRGMGQEEETGVIREEVLQLGLRPLMKEHCLAVQVSLSSQEHRLVLELSKIT